ncbi:DNA primase [Demequina globuliformis]|uniref:DNA primase n=1 Tax=Demequina globuliformis TaxID=676202 RepID=UPI0007803DDC|nr:DNA primase [Demequina globuliformis]
MAGTINRDDIASVREKAPIEDIIGQHVALKPAGVGSVKGLCPFHDERSPSFHVRPAAGRWHCFGCGEGGDVIEFVMRIDGLPFAEAVEYLADRAGVTLRYEAGGGPKREGTAGQRKRLLEAHRVAQEYFAEQLHSPEARIGRDFLRDRGFDRAAAEHFGVGYAPQGWSHLTDHLRGKAFTEAELRTSGLVSEGSRGVYDRFRGRLVWPIRDVTGDVIGFGARRLHDEDQGPKYLNTPETPLYKKNQVLYGIDLAKGAIRSERSAVVVEGYTDVMACHLAGITNAVATCGTAFGEEHVKVVRRLMGDVGGSAMKVGSTGAKVIFTFDGDEAGQNAALKSFQLDQQFLAQTFVAVDPDGKDPCDLRMAGGDQAVQALLEARTPLFEFVIRTALGANDLETPEGRAAALRAAAPVVAGIRDRAIQPEYARRLAGWLGMDIDVVRRAVADSAKSRGREPAPVTGAVETVPQGYPNPGAPERPNRRDPVVRAEALSLGTLLQAPGEILKDPLGSVVVQEMAPQTYSVPQYRAVFEAILAAGGPAQAGPDWANDVAEQASDALAATISELAVSPLPHDRPETIGHYAGTVLARVLDLSLTRQIAELRGRMQRAGAGTEGAQEAFAEIIRLETRRRLLRDG